MRPALQRALACVTATLVLGCAPPSRYDPSPIEVRADPGQRPVAQPVHLRVDAGGWEWTITPKAEVIFQGVVVGRERYRFDVNAKLSPCDLAVAWGPLVGHEDFDEIDFEQGSRRYFFRVSRAHFVDPAFIARFSANVHIVPAHPSLGRAACSVRRGDRVALAGDLVAIEGRKGQQRFVWDSSLSRTDTGDGACELLYLRRLKVNHRIYE